MADRESGANEYVLPKAKSMSRLHEARFASGKSNLPFFRNVKRRKTLLKVLIVFCVLAAVAAVVIVTLRGAFQVKLTRVTVAHEQVPESFDGYKILQISDIYGQEFGDRQSKIKKLLEGVEYDMILLTGDYLGEEDDGDYWAIRDLMACLDTSKPIYYILGDRDYQPANVSDTSDKWKMCITPAKKTDFMKFLEDEYGAIFIYPTQKITNDSGDSIYLTGITYDREANSTLDFDQDEDFSICVTHKPINYNVTRRLKDVNKRTITEVDYDLSISGHTLGGTVRLPVLGAIYWSEAGWFPQESDVLGLSEDGYGRYNYISGGLGTESGIRINDMPEISLIELKTLAVDSDG